MLSNQSLSGSRTRLLPQQHTYATTYHRHSNPPTWFSGPLRTAKASLGQPCAPAYLRYLLWSPLSPRGLKEFSKLMHHSPWPHFFKETFNIGTSPEPPEPIRLWDSSVWDSRPIRGRQPISVFLSEVLEILQWPHWPQSGSGLGREWEGIRGHKHTLSAVTWDLKAVISTSSTIAAICHKCQPWSLIVWVNMVQDGHSTLNEMLIKANNTSWGTLWNTFFFFSRQNGKLSKLFHYNSLSA